MDDKSVVQYSELHGYLTIPLQMIRLIKKMSSIREVPEFVVGGIFKNELQMSLLEF